VKYNAQIQECDDEEDAGRILNDVEYAQVLNTRNDIFLIEKESRLHKIEVAAVVIGVIFSAWLSTFPLEKAAFGSHRKIPQERTATLLRGQVLPATHPETETDYKGSANERNASRYNLKSGVPKPQAAKEHRAPAGFRPDIVSKISSGKAPPKIDTQTPEAKEPNQQEPIVAQESIIEEDSGLISEGNAYKKQENHIGAFAAFKRVLSHDPRNTPALTGMGDLFLQTGFLDSAATFYNAALAVNPHNAVVRNDLGSVHYYISTLAANPHYAARMKISDPARYIKAQYDSAIAEYTNAIALDSTCVDAMTNRGVIRDIHGDRTAAIEDYTRAIKINPSWADAYSKRAATYKSLKKYKEAIADYTAAIKLDSSSYEFDPTLRFANAYFGRGTVYYRRGELDNAIADFDSALALNPTHSLVMINKAIALSDKKQYDSAIAGYTRAIALLSPLEYDGAQKVAYLHRGNAFKVQGRYDQAIADYTSALELPNLAAKACWRIAECYALKKDRENAIVWLKKSISYGFTDFKEWENDRDLLYLRDDKEFREIIKHPQ
jgi:tetratricopeptide (TPR) repeat protein